SSVVSHWQLSWPLSGAALVLLRIVRRLCASAASGIFSLAHFSAQVSTSPLVSHPAGGAAASRFTNSCSEVPTPAACIACTTAAPSQKKCRFLAGGTAGSFA